MIELKGIERSYLTGSVLVPALTGIDLSIAAGESVGVQGPSGSGKSTLLHILGCLDGPDAGSYLFNGTSITSLSRDELTRVRRQDIGYVFQELRLIPVLSAYENVTLPLSILPLSAAEVHNRASDALAALGLADRMHRVPGELSGGERQRVALARAIAKAPRLLIADEPTAHLDSEAGDMLLAYLYRLHAELGMVMVIASHDQAVLDRATQIVKLRDGARIDEAGL